MQFPDVLESEVPVKHFNALAEIKMFDGIFRNFKCHNEYHFDVHVYIHTDLVIT